MNQIEAEHWEEDSPLNQYFNDVFNRHTGEVALAFEERAPSIEYLPLDVAYWHEQFATSEEQRLRFKAGAASAIGDSIDVCMLPALNSIQRTTIIAKSYMGGHWRLNGGMYSLLGFFDMHGEKFTPYDLMRWYVYAPKLVKKRSHPEGNGHVRAVAKERFRVHGHYGHRDEAA